jgi:hypothetical protein
MLCASFLGLAWLLASKPSRPVPASILWNVAFGDKAQLIVAVHRALKSAIACSRVAEYPDCELTAGFHVPLSSKTTADRRAPADAA